MRDRWELDTLHARSARPPLTRVALLSVHTCPLDQPGTGDSGGMNVYVRQVSRRLAEMGVLVDVFTRASGQAERITHADPGVRVVHLEAGPDRPIPKEQLSEHLCEFLYSLVRFEASEAARAGVERFYDLVHSHYWLSGWVARRVRERWNVPFVQSFHTLGRVKNLTLVPGDMPEPPSRIAMEERIVETADCVLAPTDAEAAELVRLYGANPERVRVVAPGVDTEVFRPGDGTKRALGLDGRNVVLFVGRLQLLKAPDVAVRSIAELARARPDLDPLLLIVGGPSGTSGLQRDGIEKLAADLGVADRVSVRPPVPHGELAKLYRAADAVLVPSRSESFGLVALEAAACGRPVVAASVGGLRTIVRDGVTGLLVDRTDPGLYAAALEEILAEPARAIALGEAGSRFARRFDWRNAAAGLLTVYEEEAARSDGEAAVH